jgi:hypothetical protein
VAAVIVATLVIGVALEQADAARDIDAPREFGTVAVVVAVDRARAVGKVSAAEAALDAVAILAAVTADEIATETDVVTGSALVAAEEGERDGEEQGGCRTGSAPRHGAIGPRMPGEFQ